MQVLERHMGDVNSYLIWRVRVWGFHNSAGCWFHDAFCSRQIRFALDGMCISALIGMEDGIVWLLEMLYIVETVGYNVMVFFFSVC